MTVIMTTILMIGHMSGRELWKSGELVRKEGICVTMLIISISTTRRSWPLYHTQGNWHLRPLIEFVLNSCFVDVR